MNPRTFTKEYAEKKLAEIAANREKIDGCKKHQFKTDPPLHFGMKFECKNCGGYMDSIQAFRYCQGYEAAGGDPNEIIPHFR